MIKTIILNLLSWVQLNKYSIIINSKYIKKKQLKLLQSLKTVDKRNKFDSPEELFNFLNSCSQVDENLFELRVICFNITFLNYFTTKILINITYIRYAMLIILYLILKNY